MGNCKVRARRSTKNVGLGTYKQWIFAALERPNSCKVPNHEQSLPGGQIKFSVLVSGGFRAGIWWGILRQPIFCSIQNKFFCAMDQIIFWFFICPCFFWYTHIYYVFFFFFFYFFLFFFLRIFVFANTFFDKIFHLLKYYAFMLRIHFSKNLSKLIP